MKIAFLCPFAHVTIVNKSDLITGTVPEKIQCTHLNCGHIAGIFENSVMDETVHATHEFYKPAGEILTLEEIQYVGAGGLMFREIPGQQPPEVVKEFRSTDEIITLATYIIKNFPEQTGKGTPVEAAIRIMKGQTDVISMFGLTPFN